ncbi:MAG TPA: response regulator [Polyangiales bacterium]|nr:response regulator [Polyangiales bacterium]
MSLTGVFIETDQTLPIGTTVQLDIRPSPRAQPVKTIACVTEVVTEDKAHPERKAGMALDLLEIWGERSTEQLAEYLHRAASRDESLPRWTAGARVLVVDDNEQYREQAATTMREAGFEVLTAGNGFEALSLALRNQPSVIVSDINMPGMDGWQLLRVVRARPALRRTPVVFLTDLTSEQERLRGYELGVDDYVTKPFTGVDLIARVERVLERASEAERSLSGGMRGDLGKMPLASFLAFAELEKRTGELQLEHDGEKATLSLSNGAVTRIELHAAHDALPPLERFFHVLDWQHGHFEFSATSVPSEDVIGIPTTHALLEHARRHDEETQG